ncbi:MAG: UDP-N-acetylmuramate--L-alanine ligase [Clostridia bacterium]|nr:UDP-N-acetylmuramate--L-alanine ligase [Clostridia bacterium]
MANLNQLRLFRNIHMRGIGGTSMSGIAEMLKHWGFHVTGSDDNSSELTEKLISQGIPVTIGYDFDNVSKSNLVVYTAAIKEDDPELLQAKTLNIPIVERGEFLGEITKAFEDTICVSGTHGKTTTTSMISLCFMEAGLDPTVQVGAILKQLGGNSRVGNSEYFILEACEYVESYLSFHPKTEIVLNIDNDHLDYFGSLENIITSFENYVKLLPEEGLLIVNSDDPNCSTLSKCADSRIVTFGLTTNNANFVARNISFNNNGFPTFDVYYNNNFYKTISLSVPGKHNVLNALACIATCHSYGIDKQVITDSLKKFTGAHRRYEFVGTINKEVNVFDDYAHHPTEIQAIAEATKQKQHNNAWIIFQPHTYSRTKSLLHEFAKALSPFDNIIITDIYAAREQNTYDISAQDLVTEITKMGRKAIYMSDFGEIAQYIRSHTIKNDLVLTVGAGTIVNLSQMIVDKPEEYNF